MIFRFYVLMICSLKAEQFRNGKLLSYFCLFDFKFGLLYDNFFQFWKNNYPNGKVEKIHFFCI